jgi:hypothetical protein
MPNVRRGALNKTKQAVTATTTVNFAQVMQTAEDAKNVTELRLAVKELASAVKSLAAATGLWKEKGA